MYSVFNFPRKKICSRQKKSHWEYVPPWKSFGLGKVLAKFWITVVNISQCICGWHYRHSCFLWGLKGDQRPKRDPKASLRANMFLGLIPLGPFTSALPFTVTLDLDTQHRSTGSVVIQESQTQKPNLKNQSNFSCDLLILTGLLKFQLKYCQR